MFMFEFRLKQGPGKASLVQGSDKVIPKSYLKHFRPYRVRLAVEHDRFFTMFKRGPNEVQTRSKRGSNEVQRMARPEVAYLMRHVD